MTLNDLLYNRKNAKFPYYFRNYLRHILPRTPYQHSLGRLLRAIDSRPDSQYIHTRIDYCCRLGTPVSLPAEGTLPLSALHQPHKPKVYWFDTYEYTRYFPDHYRLALLPGDITYVPDLPSVVKSRPIGVDNTNSILLNLDKVRHFIFLRDTIPFTRKDNRAIFRGKVYGKQQRQQLMRMYIDHPMCDFGDIRYNGMNPPEWVKDVKTLRSHLNYKFIMAIEGNDMASNLKWVMSSNSLAVMPQPTCETWFMEQQLQPDIHYVCVKPDFSDLIPRLEYYATRPAEAQAIIDNAHSYVRQFQDPLREKLISIGVLHKYFRLTGQI